MDIGRTFSFVQEDEEWITKILIGGLLILVPILGGLVVLGYMAQVARNVAVGEPKPLPRWGEFGSLLVRGLHYLVITLIYLLPYFVIVGLFSCVTGGIGASLEDSESAGATLGALSCIIIPLMLILAFGGAALSYVGLARYISTDRLSAAFEFGEVIALLRNHIGLWLMALVVAIISGVVASVGIIACGVGVLFTSFFAYCMQGHALGQIIRTINMAPTTDTMPPATPPTIQL